MSHRMRTFVAINLIQSKLKVWVTDIHTITDMAKIRELAERIANCGGLQGHAQSIGDHIENHVELPTTHSALALNIWHYIIDQDAKEEEEEKEKPMNSTEWVEHIWAEEQKRFGELGPEAFTIEIDTIVDEWFGMDGSTMTAGQVGFIIGGLRQKVKSHQS